MALQKQTITLDFGFGGLDQKTDEKLIQRTKMVDLTNARFDKAGRIDRRTGYDAFGAMSQTITRLMVDGQRLYAVTGKDEATPPYVYRFTTTGASALVLAGQSPIDRMPLADVRVENVGPSRRGLIVGISSSTAATPLILCDRADGTNYYALVSNGYPASNTGATAALYIELRDRSNNTLYKAMPELTIASMTASFRVVANPAGGDHFLLASMNASNSVQLHVFSATTDPTAVSGFTAESASGTGANTLGLVPTVDPNATGGSAYWLAMGKAASGVKLSYFAFPTTAGVGANIANTTIPVLAGSCTGVNLSTLNNPSNTTNTIRLSWLEGTAGGDVGVRTGTYSRTCSQVLAPISGGAVSVSIRQLVGAESMTTHWLGLMYLTPDTRSMDVHEVAAASTVTNNGTLRARLNGMVPASEWRARPGAPLVHGLFLYDRAGAETDRAIFPMQFSPSLTTNDTQARVVGRLFAGNASSKTPFSYVRPNLQCIDGEYVVPALVSQRVSFSTAAVPEKFGVAQVKFQVAADGWMSVPVRDEVVFTGGYAGFINDSDGPAPLAPLVPPRIALSTTTTGSLVPGSYAASGIYEYIDARGRVHRSPPAVAVTITLSVTGAFVVTYDGYPLHDGLQDDQGRLRFVPYRTLVNESQVFYRNASSTGICPVGTQGIPGSVSLFTYNTTLSTTDAGLASQQPLYTTGGVYEDYCPSAPVAMASNGRRVLCVEAERPTDVLEGKVIADGLGVAWLPEARKPVRPGGDRIYALAAFLDKWLAFKATQIFIAAGDGADSTGQNDTLSDFEPLTDGNGCTQPRSVVATSAGVFYRSASGFRFIGSDLVDRFIGDAVEDYTSPVKDATFDAENDLVFFLLEDQTLLVCTMFETAQGLDFRWSRDFGGT